MPRPVLSRLPLRYSGLALVFFLPWTLFPVRAGAHTENSQAFSTIRIEASRISYDLYLDYFELARVVRLDASRGAPLAVLQRALDRSRPELEAYLAARLHVSLDGVICPSHLTATGVEHRLDREHARIVLEFPCPGARSGRLLVRYLLFFDDSDDAHRNVVTYETTEGQSGQFVFTVSERELTLGRGTLPGQFLRFVELGIRHILAGYDHLLFVVALLLGTTTLAGVFGILSLFTLAHSVTLAAAVLGVLRVPPEIVEPLIALSIAFVAVESLLAVSPRFRLAVVFAFGLVHGMGFAGALQITGVQGWNIAAPLLFFNLGIELGQGTMALLIFPLLVRVRDWPWSHLAQGLAQVAIGVFGLCLYFERLIGERL
jgi:hypothetical protein